MSVPAGGAGAELAVGQEQVGPRARLPPVLHLEDEGQAARAQSGDETRRVAREVGHVDERGTLHSFCKSNNVLRANYICSQRTLERGIESYVSGAVDNDVDVVSNTLRFFFGVTKVGFANVTTENYDLVANEPLERVPVTFTQRIEWWRGEYVVPET